MTKRRRVFFFIPTLSGGGAERVIITLLRSLDRSKFLLTLVVVDLRGAVFRNEVPDDVELVDLKSTRVRYSLFNIIKLIWQKNPDVVFTTLGHLNLALAMIKPFLPRYTRYYARETIVISENLRFHQWSMFWRWAYRWFYDRFDKVICQSKDMRDDLCCNFGFPHEKAVVVHNPVDVDQIQGLVTKGLGVSDAGLDAKNIHLVSAGRLTQQKGFDILIEAFALCDYEKLYLTILGEGPLGEELEQLAVNKGVADRVRFVGFQNNPYAFFAQADAFVLSSRFEGFPNVVLEALACGTPVISTPAPGGVKEILGDVPDCIIAASITSEALADAITTWISTCHQRVNSDVVAPYTVDKIIKKYEKILENSAEC